MTTEEKARAYAEKRTEDCVSEHYGSMMMRRRVERFDSYDIEQAYEDGATEALASQWKDPKVELPKIPDGKKLMRVLAWVGDEPLVCWYTCHGRFITTLAAKERYSYDSLKDVKIHLSSEREDVTEIATAWLSIPPLKGGEA